jgi:hypothetical protein
MSDAGVTATEKDEIEIETAITGTEIETDEIRIVIVSASVIATEETEIEMTDDEIKTALIGLTFPLPFCSPDN